MSSKSREKRRKERSLGPPPDPGPFLHVSYNTEHHETGHPNEQYDLQPPDDVELTILGVHRGQQGFFPSGIKVTQEVFDAPEVFLVTVRYSDGDSYKTTHGLHQFESFWLTEAEAEERKAYLQRLGRSSHYDPRYPWTGSMSGLESVTVTRHRVQP